MKMNVTMLVFMEKMMRMSTRMLLMTKNTMKRTSLMTMGKELADKLLDPAIQLPAAKCQLQDPAALSLQETECMARRDHPEFEQSADSVYLGDLIFGYAL